MILRERKRKRVRGRESKGMKKGGKKRREKDRERAHFVTNRPISVGSQKGKLSPFFLSEKLRFNSTTFVV